ETSSPATERTSTSTSFVRGGRHEACWESGGSCSTASTRSRRAARSMCCDRRCDGGGRALAAGPAEALELAPEALAGPALAPDSHDSRSDFGHDRRWAVVHVARGGNGGSHTRLDRLLDHHDSVTTRDQGLHPIACANLRRRLRGHSVHENVTTV